jgi:hypothetical protein
MCLPCWEVFQLGRYQGAGGGERGGGPRGLWATWEEGRVPFWYVYIVECSRGSSPLPRLHSHGSPRVRATTPRDCAMLVEDRAFGPIFGLDYSHEARKSNYSYVDQLQLLHVVLLVSLGNCGIMKKKNLRTNSGLMFLYKKQSKIGALCWLLHFEKRSHENHE